MLPLRRGMRGRYLVDIMRGGSWVDRRCKGLLEERWRRGWRGRGRRIHGMSGSMWLGKRLVCMHLDLAQEDIAIEENCLDRICWNHWEEAYLELIFYLGQAHARNGGSMALGIYAYNCNWKQQSSMARFKERHLWFEKVGDREEWKDGRERGQLSFTMTGEIITLSVT